MSRNIHINLFKHSDGLSLCLSKAEEGESSASQSHPDDASHFLPSWQTAQTPSNQSLHLREEELKERRRERKKGRGRETTSHFTKQGSKSRVCHCFAQGPDTNRELGLEEKMLTFFYQLTKITKYKHLETFF